MTHLNTTETFVEDMSQFFVHENWMHEADKLGEYQQIMESYANYNDALKPDWVREYEPRIGKTFLKKRPVPIHSVYIDPEPSLAEQLYDHELAVIAEGTNHYRRRRTATARLAWKDYIDGNYT